MDVAARAMHGRAAAGANVAAHLAGSPMSTYALGSVFSPTSVAVVGASPRERSLGRLVLRQLREGGFAGPVGLVNPNYREIDGLASAPRLDALGFAPELRSEERRVGKECVSPCRSRWCPSHKKKKQNTKKK